MLMQYEGDNRKTLSFVVSPVAISVLILSLLLNLTFAQEIVEIHKKTLYEITKQLPNQNLSVSGISVGELPFTIGLQSYLGSRTHTVFVANSQDNTVSVIDGTNNTVIGEIEVGNLPIGVGVLSLESVFVANSQDNTVSVIDGTNNTVIGEIEVPLFPYSVVVDDTRYRIYTTHPLLNTVSVIDGTNNTVIGEIEVGKGPRAIALDWKTHTLYVTNSFNNTVSVIDGTNNTVVGEIDVGKEPRGIGVDSDTHTIFVANSQDNTVSVINATTNTLIGGIIVGKEPEAVEVDSDGHIVYVSNYGSDSISVINGTDYTVIGEIEVGKGPMGMGYDFYTDTLYVANSDENTVSVIDANANKVVTGVIFNIEPFNSGHIECGKDNFTGFTYPAPIKKQFYLWSGSECTAKPNQGFEFVNWQENLKGNATQFLSYSSPSTAWDSILDFFNMKGDKAEATVDISKFGSFTANFKQLPPPIPNEYILGLFSIVASTVLGWSIPSIIGWFKYKRQTGVMFEYHRRILNLGKIDQHDIISLNKLNDNLAEEYSKGNISDKHYENMKNEISVLYYEFYKNSIYSMNQSSGTAGVKESLFAEIDEAYAKGKLNELHYLLLKDKVKGHKDSQNIFPS